MAWTVAAELREKEAVYTCEAEIHGAQKSEIQVRTGKLIEDEGAHGVSPTHSEVTAGGTDPQTAECSNRPLLQINYKAYATLQT